MGHNGGFKTLCFEELEIVDCCVISQKAARVDVLANGIWFANGIGVDKDEKFIVVS